MGSWGSWLQQSGAGSGAGYSSTLAAFASPAQAQSSATQESSALGQEFLGTLRSMADCSAAGEELTLDHLVGGLRATYVLRHWHTLSCLQLMVRPFCCDLRGVFVRIDPLCCVDRKPLRAASAAAAVE